MNKGHKETITIRLVSCAFMVLAIAVFKPFGLEVWQWQAYIHLLCIFALGLLSCLLTEAILRYIVRMPRSYEHGVSYIISRNLRFQCINTPLVSLLICLYRHFAMSSLVEGNRLSPGNYIETLVIIAFLSFAIGLYWRFKFRSRYLAAELEEIRLLNEQLKSLTPSPSPKERGVVTFDRGVISRRTIYSPLPGRGAGGEAGGAGSEVTLTGTTNESVSLDIYDLLYIEAVGNYVKVVIKQGDAAHPHMLRSTMKQMEDTLQTYPMIVRCHRAFLVNLGQVEQISSNSHAMQLVMRHSHDAIPVSRSNMAQIKKAVNSLP